MEGLDLEKVSNNFGNNYSDQLLVAAEKYIHTNKLQNIHSKLILTKEGKLFADGIAADLFFD
jgi:oxygen-independent coproporphyrinogen-3 oxidase